MCESLVKVYLRIVSLCVFFLLHIGMLTSLRHFSDHGSTKTWYLLQVYFMKPIYIRINGLRNIFFFFRFIFNLGSGYCISTDQVTVCRDHLL